MKYNFDEIGKRIIKERKAAGFKSQDSFIEHLRTEYGYSLSRNTLSAIENGKTNHYDADLLFAMCEIFNCEMGYLLGEYECKTGRVTDIVKETGLTPDAVNTLRIWKEQKCSDLTNSGAWSDRLSDLICAQGFNFVMDDISRYYTQALLFDLAKEKYNRDHDEKPLVEFARDTYPYDFALINQITVGLIDIIKDLYSR